MKPLSEVASALVTGMRVHRDQIVGTGPGACRPVADSGDMLTYAPCSTISTWLGRSKQEVLHEIL